MARDENIINTQGSGNDSSMLHPVYATKELIMCICICNYYYDDE